MNLSVVIPLINEENSLEELVSSISSVVNEINLNYEIILIDDGSIVYTSGSGNIFKSGIPIGIFNKNENISEEVKFFSKLSQLTFVKLVSFEGSKN